MTDAPPPWEVPGVPYALAPEVFAAAADAWVLHKPQSAGVERVRPAMGVWGHFTNCAGNGYEDNQARTARLLARAPVYVDGSGGRVYPAVFAPDPTPGANGTTPLAVITSEGYIGSAWGALATEFAPVVLRGFRPDAQGSRLLFATVVHIFAHPIPGVSDFQSVEVWVPKPAAKADHRA